MVQKTICASPTTSRTWRASTNQPRRSRPQESITAATPEAFRFQRLIPVTAKRRTPPRRRGASSGSPRQPTGSFAV